MEDGHGEHSSSGTGDGLAGLRLHRRQRRTGRPSRIAITAYGTPDAAERVTAGGGEFDAAFLVLASFGIGVDQHIRRLSAGLDTLP